MRHETFVLILVTLVAFMVTVVALTDPDQLQALAVILGATVSMSRRL